MNMSRVSALLVALLFSAGAFAQSDTTGPNMHRTPDGVTPTPDATSPPAGEPAGKHMRHKDGKKDGKMHKQKRTDGQNERGTNRGSDSTAPNMQRTPDGVTPTPDGTSVPTR